MSGSKLERALIFYFRIAMAWTFLYAGLSQLMEPNFTAAGFLNHTKTFHSVYAWFAGPDMLPYTDFLVQWGHTLIGLSLLFGFMVRPGAVFGILLMGVYYFAHMDFPYVDSPVNFIMEYHLVYAGVLVFLFAERAGHVWGLDGWIETLPVVAQYPRLRALVH